MVIVTLAAGFAVLAVALVGLACAFGAVADLFVRVARRDDRPPATATIGKALFAASVVASPFLTARLVSERNGWIDADGNGLLDPLVNGSYDWFDINGGDFVRLWGLLSGVLLIGWAIATRESSREGS